ncbi:MAG TPA: hypothetical protein VGB17_02460 [Pyrinomonadaceae bacterium]
MAAPRSLKRERVGSIFIHPRQPSGPVRYAKKLTAGPARVAALTALQIIQERRRCSRKSFRQTPCQLEADRFGQPTVRLSGESPVQSGNLRGS